MTKTKEAEPLEEQRQLAVQQPSAIRSIDLSSGIDFAALAANPDISVDKLERLMSLHERSLARQAEYEFNVAFVEMQAKLPVVLERGKGDKNIRYAKREDIVKAVRPVLAEHGFSLNFSTVWPDDKTIVVTGTLTHMRGHSVKSEFRAQPDQTGSKNAIQAQGSSIEYGRRYTTLDLLNIVSSEHDDDGRGASDSVVKEAPDGFDTWLTDMEITAEDGIDALQAVWNSSKPDLKRHLIDTDKSKWEALKQKAHKSKKS